MFKGTFLHIFYQNVMIPQVFIFYIMRFSLQILSDSISVNGLCLIHYVFYTNNKKISNKKCLIKNIFSKKKIIIIIKIKIDWQSNLLNISYLLFHVRNEVWDITLLRSVSSINFYGHVQELPWGLVFNVQFSFSQGRAHSCALKPPKGEGIPICPLNVDTSMPQMCRKQKRVKVEFLHSTSRHLI